MMRFKNLIVTAALLIWAASFVLELGPRYSDGSPCVGCILVITVATLAALITQTWIMLTALSLLLIGSMVGQRWRYLLVVVALVSWLAMHLLNYVSWIDNWPVVAFKVSWIALFFLALAAPFFRRWRELAICCLTLFFTFDAFLLTSQAPEPVVLPNRWLQEAGFRVYASHLIRSSSLEEFLSGCELVDYVEQDGTRQQVGECDRGLRSTVWFRLLVIYDPSGQLARPAVERTLAWRFAVLHLPEGRSFVHDNDAKHLAGNFYWFLDVSPARGDDEKVRSDQSRPMVLFRAAAPGDPVNVRFGVQ